VGAADGSQTTAEALELRQQFEKDLITKIKTTLEPVLGPDRFRAGATVDIDLTSGEQQEETFDPSKSVMVSSQKTEDMTDRGTSNGVPGTASNLPRGNSTPSGGGVGSSRRSESVSYQSSRTVRHTRIPQGIVKRMSLAVLLDQTPRWEGQGAAKHRVFDPPKPETIQTIKSLITAATGLNSERGDQLIIDSLPFETTVNPETPFAGDGQTKKAPAPTGPKWLQFMRQYSDLIAPISAAVVILVFLAFLALRMMSSKKQAAAEAAKELEAGAAAAELEGGQGADARQVAGAGFTGQLEDADIVEKVRQMAKRDSGTAANVVRMWLQEGK
jgi:flagellar M-ring protein FliF